MRSLHLVSINRMLSSNTSISSSSSSSNSPGNFSSQNSMGMGNSLGNQIGNGIGNGEAQWKVLVYDEFCRDSLAPFLASQKSLLRDHGITLRMIIKSNREPIPDAPAVYFIKPTQENILLIANDCAKGLYESAFIHFCDPVPRNILELLAKEVAKTHSVSSINKVYDQFLGFISLEQNLFTLNRSKSFVAYNRPSVNEIEIESYIENITDGLLSAIVTLGSVPVIRCPRNGPSEMVARKLYAKLRDLLNQPDSLNLFSSTKNNLNGQNFSHMIEQRPVLLILDRAIDMGIPLLHSSGYQPLVDDILGIHLNKVSIQSSSTDQTKISNNNNKQGDDKSFLLDPEIDAFWANYAGEMFPNAIKAHQTELKEVTDKVDKMRAGLSNGASDDTLGTSNIMGAVQSLPELTEKKKGLMIHVTILQSVLEQIKRRSIPEFHELEKRMVIQKQKIDKTKITPLLSDQKKEYEDKVRLLAIYIICMRPSTTEINELESVLDSSIAPEQIKDKTGPYSKVIPFIKWTMSFSSIGNSNTSANNAIESMGGGNIAQGAANIIGAAWNFQTSLLQNVAMSVTGGSNAGTVARTLDNVSKSIPDDQSSIDQSSPSISYLYLDPRVRAENVPLQSRIKSEFKRGIVFMIGGGCYEEYHNILQFQKSYDRELIYGCTEIINPSKIGRAHV